MQVDTLDLATFESNLATAFENSHLTCYAVVDHAQDAALLLSFKKNGLATHSKCLLPAALDTEMADYAPHLLELSPLAADSEAWPDILKGGAAHPASFTLLASRLSFDQLWISLTGFTEIVLPDGTEMICAFWDPAVLGTMTGQMSDHTLHVPTPVLSERQRARLLHGIFAWWYWDRNGNPQQVLPRENWAAAAHLVALPLHLAQVQVDMLVEAGLPDLLLSMVRENQPQLLRDVAESQHYKIIEQHLFSARQWKIFGIRDILNYACAALIYGDAMKTDPRIGLLMEQVKREEIDFEVALGQFP